MKKLLFFWKELLATFWFVPVIIIGLAVLLSVSLVSLDNIVNISQEGWIRFFLVNSSDSARSILSTISGAMIGVAGTVFSVTLVALTLASSQFGPRLIKNFMYVRLNQVVLGSYIATYLYCLLVLNAIKDGNGYTFIPSFSILVAILAAIANIILLIVFIHQIAVSIQADKVISDISDIISKQVETLFPEKMGDELKGKKDFDEDKVVSEYQKTISIKSTKSGYLRYIDSEAILEIIADNDSLFELKHRPGSFIVKGEEIGVVYSSTEWQEESIDELVSQFVFGKTKTSQQDLEFSIHQMVEIAARALSPGVNDPYTAIACIDNLTETLCYLAQAKFPSKYRVDEDGKLRVIADVLDFEGVLDAAFNQIRQFSAGSTAVIIRLVEALTTIQNFTKKEGHKKAIINHVEMVLRLGKETIKEKNDLDDLKKRVNQILK
ncbi:DUF2254 domain-containing protein [Cyclobacterium salsum]|uniref:DUF2254 domain-containing protein n=1 Tax=Cyclobacterium salsum TaxID=2666329 RepID=UPI001391D5E4|nr:DUF2254 domain-containing protein [Cyclobacterium salsum]